MALDIRRTYYYLVCFATLLMSIIGTVQVVQHALDLAFPRTYAPSRMDYMHRFPPVPEGFERPSQEEMVQMAREEAERNRRMEQRSALRRLLGSLVLVAIALPVYRHHWSHVRRLEDTKNPAHD